LDQNKLQKLLVISDRVKNFYNDFNDIMFVDTTFRKNRFNMVILDMIGVDQFGHNILFGFALLNNSKEATF